MPTIGVAKSLLVGKTEDNGKEESPITLDGKTIGIRLSLPGNRPLYVSVGNRVSLSTAIKIVRKVTEDKARDPLRIADRLSKEQSRNRSKEVV